MGRSGLERPWNWLTGTDASPDDLLLGGSRKVEEPFGRIDPDDVRPSADLPDRDPRNGLTDAWRVVPGDRLVTFELGGLPESWRISAVRPNAADLYLVVNDPMTGEFIEPDLMAILSDGCFDFDISRETPEWQGFWKSEHGMVAYRDASGFVRRWTPGHGLGTEVVSPAKHGLWFDVPDVSLAKLAGQGCRMVKPTHGKGQCKPRPWGVSSP